jgi:hypothetical protein
MNFQEMAGKSELGTLLDIKIDWQEQEIEVAEPFRTVSESCSEIQKNGSMEEAGPAVVEELSTSCPPAIQEELIPGSIELDPWKKSLDVSGQDSSENHTPVESQESFISGQRDESVEEFPESQSEGDLKV